VTWSLVPVYNSSQLNPLLQKLLDDVILPALNKGLSTGLPLPALGPLKLVDPHVSYDQGYVTLATGFEFVPSVLGKDGGEGFKQAD
jgi:hypothetical protein